MSLDHFWVGRCYEVSPSVGALLVAEGWAIAALPEEVSEDDDGSHITADLLARLARRYDRAPRGDRRIARFPLDRTAAVAHDWPDRRGQPRPRRR